MNAADFNARFKIDDIVIHDPAPLLGEPTEECIVLDEAFDKTDGDPDFPVLLWSGVKVKRPTGDSLIAQLDHLRL